MDTMQRKSTEVIVYPSTISYLSMRSLSIRSPSMRLSERAAIAPTSRDRGAADSFSTSKTSALWPWAWAVEVANRTDWALLKGRVHIGARNCFFDKILLSLPKKILLSFNPTSFVSFKKVRVFSGSTSNRSERVSGFQNFVVAFQELSEGSTSHRGSLFPQSFVADLEAKMIVSRRRIPPAFG